MATETLSAAHDRKEINFTKARRRRAALVVGAGANTAHMEGPLRGVAQQLDLHVFEVAPPQIEVDSDHLHMTNTVEGQRTATELLGSKTVGTVLLSLVPELHETKIVEFLGYAGEGLIHDIVVPKPLVQTVEELRIVRYALRDAIARRRQIDPSYDPDKDPMIRIQEHYRDKEAWVIYRLLHEQVMARLGRLESASIDIQEARTAEDENRVLAFRGGALEDLGPHVISLGLDTQIATNATQRYTIADRSETSIKRFRYENSELPEDVETGFVIHGKTILRDNERNEAHDLDFIWRGGKGLVDKKEVRLMFVHPDTGARSLIVIDLKANTIVVPEEIQDLFPVTQFEDNGYGHCVEVGMIGDDPLHSFQPFAMASVVTVWQQALRKQGQASMPLPHRRGLDLQHLATV